MVYSVYGERTARQGKRGAGRIEARQKSSDDTLDDLRHMVHDQQVALARADSEVSVRDGAGKVLGVGWRNEGVLLAIPERDRDDDLRKPEAPGASCAGRGNRELACRTDRPTRCRRGGGRRAGGASGHRGYECG